jgi:hypothetical protein
MMKHDGDFIHLEQCVGMKKAVESDLILLEFHEDFDGKGPAIIITLNNENTSMMIRHCPFCGEVVQNLMTGKTRCKLEKVEVDEITPADGEAPGLTMELTPIAEKHAEDEARERDAWLDKKETEHFDG